MVGIGQRPGTRGPRRGDIHFVTFREAGGNVLFGPHPAVVVQTSAMASSSTVIVAPLTSRARSAELVPPYLVRVAARDTGLDRDGWIKADRLFTFPTAGLGERAGRLSAARFEELDRALRFVLDL
ncbi:MAG: hypothetical protein A2X23_02290 [Chloroflexi bacterium GWC2_73_18]|nr:MAG: hypothetical protein A2X23_02290 [Chloroflexi bacterium GWC2_73_18]